MCQLLPSLKGLCIIETKVTGDKKKRSLKTILNGKCVEVRCPAYLEAICRARAALAVPP